MTHNNVLRNNIDSTPWHPLWLRIKQKVKMSCRRTGVPWPGRLGPSPLAGGSWGPVGRCGLSGQRGLPSRAVYCHRCSAAQRHFGALRSKGISSLCKTTTRIIFTWQTQGHRVLMHQQSFYCRWQILNSNINIYIYTHDKEQLTCVSSIPFQHKRLTGMCVALPFRLCVHIVVVVFLVTALLSAGDVRGGGHHCRLTSVSVAVGQSQGSDNNNNTTTTTTRIQNTTTRHSQYAIFVKSAFA